MTITSTPAAQIPSVSRFDTFSTTISFTDTVTSTDPVTGLPVTTTGTILSANCAKNFTDADILISNGTIENSMTVTISGIHKTAFLNDELRYVEKGSSDKLQTPTIVYNILDMPPNKDLYYLSQDDTYSVTRSYTIRVVSTLNSANLEFTQVIFNNHEVASNFIRNYFNASSN